jgi:hypothetical protein
MESRTSKLELLMLNQLVFDLDNLQYMEQDLQVFCYYFRKKENADIADMLQINSEIAKVLHMLQILINAPKLNTTGRLKGISNFIEHCIST